MNRFRGEEAARSMAEEAARSVVDLSRDESMRLLASVPFGRVVFTRDALPAVRPVNHIVDGETVIVRTRLTSRLTSTVRADSAVVVAYEADDIDRVTRLGWSVVVIGLARTITAPELVARYDALVRPWVDGVMDTIVAIEPTLVTGIRLVERESIGAEPLR
ncbi:pyridoxamine 5'-phosphate oxidase family protein [Nocardia sp. NPDC051981]|uniref:pyridoxamine 5'-phosphate oxidase family protein n=1 Tax=Nocardia sp. NPDC051981 TaxID=3155417 RepID=UPI003415CCE0